MNIEIDMYYSYDSNISDEDNIRNVINKQIGFEGLSREEVENKYGTKFEIIEDDGEKYVKQIEEDGVIAVIPTKLRNISTNKLFTIDDLFEILEAGTKEKINSIVEGFEVDEGSLSPLFD